ncbi:MAG: glycosyltransferase family 2 protein [Roseburia sp.]|nr:glycosyltransferase family 2 protein [Roseburia sp.]
MKHISVAMVSYQGAKYIEEQLDSILSQLGPKDEVIVSDDGSTDGTREILAQYAKKDVRVRMIDGPKAGVKKNVENALRACEGEYIFLADQDDIWMPEKVELVMAAFKQDSVGLVVHDAVVTDGNCQEVILESFYSLKGSGAGVIKNIWRNTYIGCCMAFKRELLDEVVPIPNYIEMHDQWIGVINDQLKRGTTFIPDKLLKYRRHGNNASEMSHYPIPRMLKNRICFVWALLTRH